MYPEVAAAADAAETANAIAVGSAAAAAAAADDVVADVAGVFPVDQEHPVAVSWLDAKICHQHQQHDQNMCSESFALGGTHLSFSTSCSLPPHHRLLFLLNRHRRYCRRTKKHNLQKKKKKNSEEEPS
jgi:hypothetical protein